MLCHTNLMVYYKNTFGLAQHHKYSISDIEGLLPYERDIYVAMLVDHLKKEKEKWEQRKPQQASTVKRYKR